MKNLLSLLLIFSASISIAQDAHFNKLHCNTFKNDKYLINDFVVMPDGFIYAVGSDSSNVIAKGWQAFLAKYDSSFNLIWRKYYGGSNNDGYSRIQYFRNNKFLIEGGTRSLDGDVVGNYPNGVGNAWICIIDTGGNLLHQTVFGNGYQTYTLFNRVRALPNGDIYYCGNSYLDSLDFSGNAPFSFNDNAYIARTDSNLNKKGHHFYFTSTAGFSSSITDASLLPNGNILVVAQSFNTGGDFPVTTPRANGATVIMEIDTLFNVVWQKRYGSETPGGYLVGIEKDVNRDEYFLIGSAEYKDGDCWDNYPYLNIGDHKYRWVMKVDALGAKLWSHIYGPFTNFSAGGDMVGGAFQFTNNQLIFTTGAKGYDDYAFGDSIGYVDTWTYHLDSMGVMTKDWRFGYDGKDWGPGLMRVNPTTGKLYFLYGKGNGAFKHYLGHNCDTTSGVNNTIIGYYDVWPASVTDIKNNYNLKIYPNPAKNEIYIEGLEDGTLIELFSIEGKRLRRVKSKSNKEIMDVANLPRGQYLIHAHYKSKKYAQKIVIE